MEVVVVVAEDGPTGLALARRESPHLILLDVMLPKINGYVIARLLKFDCRYRFIPIIMLSAKAQQEDVELGRDVGVSAYMTKPFDMDTLVATVRRCLALEAPYVGPVSAQRT